MPAKPPASCGFAELRVGAAIEKRDVSDLEDRIATDCADLKAVQRLLRASNRHLSAFNRLLTRL